MEKPNLDYLEDLCEGKEESVQRLLNVVKKELKEEVSTYAEAIASKDYDSAALWAHKIKHKIGIFGLENGYALAQKHELLLREGKKDAHEEFERILKTVQDFVIDL
ncbi:MAG: Hpt domain-containing protein [Saprospiraceae bacterium]|nr:Hpt domain-containing protein [Saprospiraceae bacterium]